MNIYLQCLLVACGFFSVLFLLATKLKNNSIVDSFWGVGFIVITLFCLWRIEPMTSLSCTATDTSTILSTQTICPGNLSPLSERVYANPPAMIVMVCVLFWGLRLSLHVIMRNYKKGEDWRYAAWRKQWGRWLVPRAFVQIFLLQAFLLWVISLPIQYVFAHPTVNSSGDTAAWLGLYAVPIGILIWLLGFYFEFMSDWQLRRFRTTPGNAGKILYSGLWHYSRHPNYFGEATMWWGIYVMSLGVLPTGWWTIVSPITITALLRFVSGVPLLEQKLLKNKDYQAYAQRTNAMFPGPPRRV